MKLLSHLRLRTKLIVLTGLCSLAFVILVGVASSMMHQRMIDDRIDKLRAVVLEARSFASLLDQQVTAGHISRDQALATFRE